MYILYSSSYIGVACGRSPIESDAQRRILESNPVLEAFGNAKTLRNDNSSRFGKWMHLLFDTSGVISGGLVIDYLLEKSRVALVGEGERNYHSFYQLCEGASDEQRERLYIKV